MKLNGSRDSIIKEVVGFLRSNLDNYFEIVEDYKAFDNGYDIAIIRNRNIIALIEVQLGAFLYAKTRSLYRRFNNSNYQSAKYIVFTDGDDYCVFTNNSLEPIKLSGIEFVKSLNNDYNMASDEPELINIEEILIQLARQLKLKALSNYLKKKRNLVKAERKSATISFVSEEEEDAFFRKLLPPNRAINSMCRFTSLNSCFELLKNNRQNMCNILCMNDRSEGLYADKKVFGIVPDAKEDAFAESDHCYILSLMDISKDDDLTMWRLYGDDARGVCIRYERSSFDINTKNFFLARISYGKLEHGHEEHKELELLRKIHEYEFGKGWRFKFNRWGIWKHFFKSYHFKDEHEIRLLYYDKNDDRSQFEWIKNKESQIVTKMQLFSFREFPIGINGIRIGPKSLEQDIVGRQMKHLADDKGLVLGVYNSDVKIYR